MFIFVQHLCSMFIFVQHLCSMFIFVQHLCSSIHKHMDSTEEKIDLTFQRTPRKPSEDFRESLYDRRIYRTVLLCPNQDSKFRQQMEAVGCNTWYLPEATSISDRRSDTGCSKKERDIIESQWNLPHFYFLKHCMHQSGILPSPLIYEALSRTGSSALGTGACVNLELLTYLFTYIYSINMVHLSTNSVSTNI